MTPKLPLPRGRGCLILAGSALTVSVGPLVTPKTNNENRDLSPGVDTLSAPTKGSQWTCAASGALDLAGCRLLRACESRIDKDIIDTQRRVCYCADCRDCVFLDSALRRSAKTRIAIHSISHGPVRSLLDRGLLSLLSRSWGRCAGAPPRRDQQQRMTRRAVFSSSRKAPVACELPTGRGPEL